MALVHKSTKPNSYSIIFKNRNMNASILFAFPSKIVSLILTICHCQGITVFRDIHLEPWDLCDSTSPFTSTPTHLISCWFTQPTLTSLALYLASWTQASPCQPILYTTGRFMPIKWLLPHGFLDKICPWPPFLSTSNLNHSCLGFQSLPQSVSTLPLQSYSLPSPSCAVIFLPSVISHAVWLFLCGNVLPDLAFSKHVHLGPMKLSLVLLSYLILLHIHGDLWCVWCNVTLYSLLFEVYMYSSPPNTHTEHFLKYL